MIKKIVTPLYGIAMIVILWWILSFVIGSNMVPTPYDTLKELVELFQQDFLFHIIYSFYRIMSSVTMSLLIGIPIGILLGVNKYIDKIVSPITYLLYPIPKIAFLPIFMVVFGIGDKSKIILMITIIIFQIIIVTKDGVKEIDKDILISAKVMRFNGINMITKVILPAILPKVFSALRVSIGIAISALFFSENYATRYGLGYFIMNSWSMVDYKGMFAGVLALSIMSLIIFKIIDYLEKKICLWNS
ncbi:MAG: ABC transporter permease [Clostridium sp.]|uniref:Aliphatic sulfonates transport permease protein SsuC n=1 Tax=Clostridium paraputrificum TaxID=29363 RepID=A0A6N3AJ12_9CLOT|nr:ABC transporter permease [Clostridium sp.]MBS5925468.1 ABC transporter permease [Clostridium sp.]MBS5984949.1 ABC transporter permease [Clostridium sp.]